MDEDSQILISLLALLPNGGITFTKENGDHVATIRPRMGGEWIEIGRGKTLGEVTENTLDNVILIRGIEALVGAVGEFTRNRQGRWPLVADPPPRLDGSDVEVGRANELTNRPGEVVWKLAFAGEPQNDYRWRVLDEDGEEIQDDKGRGIWDDPKLGAILRLLGR